VFDIRQNSPNLKNNLLLRASVHQAIRTFFIDRGYLEIETPCCIPAPAPEAHIDAMSAEDRFLQTSPEICMKRLLAAGFDRIFQICKCFRRGERGNKHLPELTLLEWYAAGYDYIDMMAQCEDLIRFVFNHVQAGPHLSYLGRTIDLTPPWHRLTVVEAFDRFTSRSLDMALDEHLFDEMMGCEIEPVLGWEKPVILYDYPARLGSLARLKPSDSRYAERFELYIGGVELCNAFSELTDPVEQKNRFLKEAEIRNAAGKKEYPLPDKFLKALSFMPDAAGNALGVDRLVMLLANTNRIDDVVAFTPEEL